MKPLISDAIRGNWATLLLPINDDESIDFGRLGDEIDAIIRADVDGVYSNGTAGEFYTQTEDEFDRVNALLAERCDAASLPFQIGASHPLPHVALDRVRRARTLQPGAFQVVLPDWFPPTDDEVVAYLERLAIAADPIPLVVYNPPHAKRVLDGTSMAAIARRVPAIVGAKVGNVDAAWFEALGDQRGRLSIFTPGHLLATHVPLGSRGAYSNVACLSPSGAQRWTDQFATDHVGAQAFGGRLLAFFGEHITPFITRERYPNAAVDKLLAAIGGWADVGTRLRWPYRWIDSSRVPALRAAARAALPELFEASAAKTAVAGGGR